MVSAGSFEYILAVIKRKKRRRRKEKQSKKDFGRENITEFCSYRITINGKKCENFLNFDKTNLSYTF